MKKIWLSLLQPGGNTAKILIFLALIAILGLGYFEQFAVLRSYLDTEALTFTLGSYRVSLYDALGAIAIVILVFWVAAIFSDVSQKQISRLAGISTGNRTLAVKMSTITIYVIAGLIALDFIGVDLTTLTIFSGALGIGLGFGLQKIASNFVSGLILLFEKSVEEGDLIELSDGTYGYIRRASARFTLIETFDGKEVLVPNEDLITNRVTNWTYSNPRGRVEIQVGVSYKSDIHKAQQLILEAAREHPRCIKDPEPNCYLLNYGDSSVDFTLLFWVDDVTEGRWGPKSDVMFAIWDKFAANNIEIPFPQRDLHIRSSDTVTGTRLLGNGGNG